MSKNESCNIDGCEKRCFSGGLCSKHYSHIKKYGKIIETKYDKNIIIEHEDCYEIQTKDNKLNYVSSYYIDKDDYYLVKDLKWTTLSNGYCYNSVNGILLHRLILIGKKEYDGTMIDHIDRDVTNCRKLNLRLATSSQNSTNISKRKNTKSKYIGVSLASCGRSDKVCSVYGCNTKDNKVTIHDDICYCNRHYKQIKRHGKITKVIADKLPPEPKNKWRAYICEGDVYKTIGTFETEEEALIERLKVELEVYGEEFAPQRHLFKEYGIV